ncbi:Dipeptidyl aminopeptidase/acylaminoacyl peptidase [Chryseobacterium carnipullorum]|nr:Dipeptidyl aminopeptidase/acylaminoacyl peptidase [Chryseobacterium carnipullorum]
MVIRFWTFVFLLTQAYCFSQNIDSLDSVYSQFYKTDLLTVSPSGKYAVVNHNNTYGKNEDEIVDLKTGKGTVVEKHIKYSFVGDEDLIMQTSERTRFQNLKRGKYNDVKGGFSVTVLKRSGSVLLYDTRLQKLILTSKTGEVLWKENTVQTYKVDEHSEQLIYASGKQVGIVDLKTKRAKTYNLESEIDWISFTSAKVYLFHRQALQLEIYTLDNSADRFYKQIIRCPEGFELAESLDTYFEIREDEHLLLPLYLKSKLIKSENSDLKITYSNRNSKDQILYHHLGIYNIARHNWEYTPNQFEVSPVYKFLNDKGDFIVYDQSSDKVENQENVVRDLKLILDYGKSSYLLAKKRSNDGNYLWDSNTRQFVYFNEGRWRSYNVDSETDILLPIDDEERKDNSRAVLSDSPDRKTILIKDRSAVMLSNEFDYLIFDLKSHHLERITNGEEKKLKYELQRTQDHYSESPWNLKLATIDLEKEMIFKRFNMMDYTTGFSMYHYKKKKSTYYDQGHYKEAVPYKNGILFTSEFAFEPLKLSIADKSAIKIVYQSQNEERSLLKNLKYHIFQYETIFGRANAALLLPIGYDNKKKYPLIVNVYEQQSLNVLTYAQPFLSARDGFNYMHYLLNGYIVLLPDLQYDISNIKNSIISSLEMSIDSAQELASVDKKNIGVLGLSFGGYETGLALGNSSYFKTGVAGVMVSDLVTRTLSQSEVMSEPNYLRVESRQYRMKNQLFDSWKNYQEYSPIYYLKNVKVPVLIWTGLKDRNVSPEQSKMFFLGMKRLQKKSVLLEYFNETHTINSKENQRDLNVRIWQWFDYYLKNQPLADWLRPITE